MTLGIRVTNLSKTYSSQKVLDDVDLQVHAGEFFSLLGPSGCGKTTLLRCLAGFEKIDAGAIYLGQQLATFLPPQKRNLNVVFQNYALFPHLTVFENIAFGLLAQRKKLNLSKQQIEVQSHKMLHLTKLTGLESRFPKQLSGGQQQRVAIARALATQPGAVLLDEPLSALDLKLRQEMRKELKQIQKETGTTFIFVTHDQEEAMYLSDRIAVMNLGKILQVGTPQEIYHAPNCRFVAEFIGECNFIDKSLLRPEFIQVKRIKNSESDRPGVIADVSFLGSDTILQIHTRCGLTLKAKGHFQDNWKPRDEVFVFWNSTHLRDLS